MYHKYNIVMIGTQYTVINAKNDNIYQKQQMLPMNNIDACYKVMNTKEYLLTHLNGNLSFPWSGTVFNSKLIKGYKFDFNKYKYAADAVFMLDILGNNNIGYINKNLFYYRQHNISTTASFNTVSIINEWILNFTYYRTYLINNNFADLLPIHQQATNMTLIGLIPSLINIKQLNLIVGNNFFQFRFMNLKTKYLFCKNILKLVVKLLLGIKT